MHWICPFPHSLDWIQIGFCLDQLNRLWFHKKLPCQLAGKCQDVLCLSLAAASQVIMGETASENKYSRWNRISDFSHLLVFWPEIGLKHLVLGSQFVTSKVTMPKLTFRRKFHWKMPYFWAFYHSKLRRKIIHFFIECVSYLL